MRHDRTGKHASVTFSPPRSTRSCQCLYRMKVLPTRYFLGNQTASLIAHAFIMQLSFRPRWLCSNRSHNRAINELQPSINLLTRIVFQSDYSVSSKPSRPLHQLPMHSRVCFKLATITYKPVFYKLSSNPYQFTYLHPLNKTQIIQFLFEIYDIWTYIHHQRNLPTRLNLFLF